MQGNPYVRCQGVECKCECDDNNNDMITGRVPVVVTVTVTATVTVMILGGGGRVACCSSWTRMLHISIMYENNESDGNVTATEYCAQGKKYISLHIAHTLNE